MLQKSKLLALLISLVVLSPGISQEWALVDENSQYFYLKDDDIGQYIFSVRVTNVDGQTLKLNRTIIPERFLNPNRLNYPNFLADWITVEEEADKWVIHRNNERVVYPHANLGESWVYDEAEGIIAQVTNLAEQELWGESDSIKTILLSAGDTIQLSKRFGVLLFPSEDGKFQLNGVKTPEGSWGDTPIGFREIFNFEIGDQFERLIGNNRGPGFHEYQRERIEIISKEQTEEYFTYGVRGIVLDIHDFGEHGYVDTFLIDAIRTYNRSSYAALDYGHFEPILLIEPWDHSYGLVSFRTGGPCSTTRLKQAPDLNYNYLHLPSPTSPDSLVCLYPCLEGPPPGHVFFEYGEGLGLILEAYTFGSSTRVELEAAIKDGIQCGTFWIDDDLFYNYDGEEEEEIEEEEEEEEEEVMEEERSWYHPNPVRETLSISFETQEQIGVRIFNGLGNLVFQKNVVEEGECLIDVSRFKRGYYQIMITNQNRQVLQSGGFIKM